MDINYINSLLKEGKTVKDVRATLGIPEKKFQKEIKELGYKFDQKKKAYIKVQQPHTEILEVEPIKDMGVATNYTTNYATLPNRQVETLSYLDENIDLIRQLLESYKINKEANNGREIIINLNNDKHLNPKPKSVRINEFVWRDWLEFTKDLTFSKSDLISQALKEFMENHK